MHLLGLVRSAEHVCCRYRLAAFGPLLAGAGHTLELLPWPKSRFRRFWMQRQVSQADAVILLRRLLRPLDLFLLRRAAKHLIFDYDDAVFLRSSYADAGLASAVRSRGFARMVRAADVVVAGNRFLRDHAAAEVGIERVRVVPTCVDPGRYPLARHEARGAGVRLAWIGSASTLQGLEQTVPLWNAIGRHSPGLRLRLLCDKGLTLNDLPVEWRPWSEATEAADLAAADIGVSWLPDDAWSRGKCGLKVLQYMAAGLPVVANPVGVQAVMIRHGVTGFLAETPAEWCAAVARLAASPALRQRLGQAGGQLVEAEYSVTQGAAHWSALLEDLAGARRLEVAA